MSKHNSRYNTIASSMWVQRVFYHVAAAAAALGVADVICRRQLQYTLAVLDAICVDFWVCPGLLYRLRVPPQS